MLWNRWRIFYQKSFPRKKIRHIFIDKSYIEIRSDGMSKKIIEIMPLRLRKTIGNVLKERPDAEEIRVRIHQPVEICCKDTSIWLHEEITVKDLEEMLMFISEYSLYAYEEEVRQGFLTIEGGHRIGFAGQVRMENGKIYRITNIRFLNIRIAREEKGCAKELVRWLYQDGEVLNSLFISKPGVGKTTYLRDVVRLISNGSIEEAGKKVCVIDERSEIAACHLGIPQNDLGRRTDVMDGCKKTEGMFMALRSMSPQVIAVDELGEEEEYQAVEKLMYSGCKVIGTIHGDCIEDVRESQMFQRYILLKRQKNGERAYSIFDEKLVQLC